MIKKRIYPLPARSSLRGGGCGIDSTESPAVERTVVLEYFFAPLHLGQIIGERMAL